jgi:hypothetical protein
MLSSLLLSKDRKVKISSFTLDDLLSNIDTYTITFSNDDINTKMEIKFEKNEKNLIKSYVKFLIDDKEVNYRYISKEDLDIFAKSYQTNVLTLINNLEPNKRLLSIDRFKEIKKIFSEFKIILRRKQINYTLNHLRNLSFINIVSLFKINNQESFKQIAKTIIELDADIITIFSKDLDFTNDGFDFLIYIHRTNLYLANFIYFFPINRIFAIIQKIKDSLFLIGSPIISTIIFMSLHNSFHLNMYHNEMASILFSFNYAIISTVLIKIIPKTIKYLIKIKI